MEAPAPGRGTIDRAELDTAEPAAPPSARRRFLLGFVLGVAA